MRKFVWALISPWMTFVAAPDLFSDDPSFPINFALQVTHLHIPGSGSVGWYFYLFQSWGKLKPQSCRFLTQIHAFVYSVYKRSPQDDGCGDTDAAPNTFRHFRDLGFVLFLLGFKTKIRTEHHQRDWLIGLWSAIQDGLHHVVMVQEGGMSFVLELF